MMGVECGMKLWLRMLRGREGVVTESDATEEIEGIHAGEKGGGRGGEGKGKGKGKGM